MTSRLRAIKVDQENVVDQKVKKIVQVAKITSTGMTKRPALGALTNATLSKPTELHKENAVVKNVKPRVDSFRRKAEGIPCVTKAKPTNVAKVQKAPTVAAKIPSDLKVATRKATLKVKSDVQKVSQEIIAPVRREESNVSRRSLCKLKDILCKEKKEKPKAPIQAPHEQQQLHQAQLQLQHGTLNEAQSKIVAHSSSLLDQACVENIDAGDSKNPLLVSEYVHEIYSYLFQLEDEMPIRKGHLDKQVEVTPKMRAVLLDWINEVSFQFRLLPETYHLTVSIIDRYLQRVPTTQRQYLQLVGIGALFLASKYEELYPPEIGDFVYIADDSYTKHQILDIEQKIIRNIDFNLGRPSSIHFLRRFSKAANTVEETHMLAKYLIELVSIDYNIAHYRPSEVAAASLLLSLKLLNKDTNITDDDLWTKTLIHYTTYTVDELQPLVMKIANLLKNAKTAQLKAVYNKYQSSKFDKIATRPELSESRLEKFIAEQ